MVKMEATRPFKANIWLQLYLPNQCTRPAQMGAPANARTSKRLVGGKGPCHGGSALCAPLNNGTWSCGDPGFFPQTFQLVELLNQEMLLHSQQLSPPWVCSPNPTFQHPALLCTRRHTAQAGVCRGAVQTMSTVLTLSCLPQTSCCVPL